MALRIGVRLGIDVGKVRIGVARSDPHGMLATPVETVTRAANGTSDIARIVQLCRELDVVEIIVGLPLALSGARTASTEDASGFAERLYEAARLPTRMIDERLTTVSAQSALHANGRTTKSARPVIDQVAAVILLQQALDIERASGNPPGIAI